MNFLAPEWALLIPGIVLLAWRVKSLRAWRPLRLGALLLVVLALCEPVIRSGGGGLDLWVLQDKSDSVAGASAAESPEIASILEESKGSDDHIYWIDYAAEAVRRDLGDPDFKGTAETRTGNAITLALAQANRERPTRLMVLTDGYATEPLGDVAEKLLKSGLPLDFRLLGDSHDADFRLAGLAAPARVLPGEAFLLEFDLVGPHRGFIPWEVWRGDKKVATGVAEMWRGASHVRLTDRLAGTGLARYQVRLRPPQGKHPEANVATTWVEVVGGPRVLLLTSHADDPLEPLLRAKGLTVDVIREPGKLKASSLTGARLVVLNNVNASRVAPEFLAALDFFVRDQGGGLLMVGGARSFGSGGYYSSSIDALLPVSMESKNESRKLAVAMSIVLDRSGSMSMSAGDGLTKMDLADAGAARAIELLGEHDAVAALAVDTSPHSIVDLAEVGPNRYRMLEAVHSIASAGGGIYTYTGLKAGWQELLKAETGQRHMILFADANDAEERGDYVHLIDEIRAGGGTISVIALGTEEDKDADFLKDVAERGGGRIFFNSNPAELPAVFAQETVSVARSAFVKHSTGTAGTVGWQQFSARAPHWLNQVDGYNLSYLRPGATAALVTTDQYEAPLVSGWSRGAGRVAAVTFPLSGDASELARAWSEYGDFVQTLGEWLLGDDSPPGALLRTAVDGTTLSLELMHDDSWNERLVANPPQAVIAETNPGSGEDSKRDLLWEKIEPGRFRATAHLVPGRIVRGVVRCGSAVLPFGPIEIGSAEWSFDPERLTELRQLSARSGGQERIDLSSVWKSPRTQHQHPIQLWLVASLIVLTVLEAAWTRLGRSSDVRGP